MYRISITKVEEKEVTKKEYQKTADTGNERDNGAVYGYVPYTTTERIETKVLDQVSDEIDLTKVIKAVNNID